MAPTIASSRRAPSENECFVFNSTEAKTLHHSLVGFDPMLELSESRDDQVAELSAPSFESNYGKEAPGCSCSNELRELATELSQTFPRALTKKEETQITLGDSAKESSAKKERKLEKKAAKQKAAQSTLGNSAKESSAKTDSELEKKAAKQKAAPSTKASKQAAAMNVRGDSAKEASKKEHKLEKKGTKEKSIPSTPETSTTHKQVKETNDIVTPPPTERKRSFRRTLSSRLSPRFKNKKSALVDSTRSSPAGLMRTSKTTSPIKSPKLKKIKSVLRRNTSSSPGFDVLPLSKPNPTSFLKDGSNMALKALEQDPLPHQVAIPTANELFLHAKLCAILDTYATLDKSYDFNDFCGVDLQALSQALNNNGKDEIPLLTPVYKILLEQLLNCATDIHVEGFVTPNAKSRVGIFSTTSNSGLIVVYHGSTEQQQKPARTKSIAVNLDPTDTNEMPVYAPFRQAYFELETQVYKFLDKLMKEIPFRTVTFVGHSFGGALATIGAVRFASARPMQRVASHTFGSPKVGTREFQTKANSLANLKMTRVEYGNDVNTGNPTDIGSLQWKHVGHPISIHGSVGTSAKLPLSPVMAYRFNDKKPVSSLPNMRISPNSIQDYVGAMEPFATKHLPWISTFVGQDGQGVCDNDHEKRLVV